MFLNRRCKRVRATEHAPHGPSRVLERIHGLAEIVKRGLVVVVELSPAPRRRSVDSSSLRRDTTVVATAARALDGVRDAVLSIIESSCPSADRDRTLAPRPRVRCSIVSLVAGAGVAALRTHCRCCPFLWVARLPVAGVRGWIREGRELRACPRHFIAPRPVFAASTCSLL